MYQVKLPFRLLSEANRRDHWARKAARVKAQRSSVALAIAGPVARLFSRFGDVGNLVVTITRIAPRALDSDNLASSAKAVRDGVADALGIDDGDARVEWRYAQMRGKAREYAVEIRIEAREAAE